MIKKINELQKEDISSYGLKAYNLSRIYSAGMLIPFGYGISNDFFSKFMENNKYFRNNIENIIREKETIINYILNKPFPLKLKEILTNALKEFSQADSVVIRSSSNFEDTENSSLAGMFCSYTDLKDIDEVISSIRKCYVSLYSDRFLSYLYENGYVNISLNMPIILQNYIRGEISGVGFTADTINMNENEVIINVTSGSCENVVQEKTFVSMYKLNKNDNNVSQLTEKNKSIDISMSTLNYLKDSFIKLEQYFSEFLDIEWTLKNNELYFLQARPITTMKIKDDSAFNPIAEKKDNYILFVKDTLTPLEKDLFKFKVSAYNSAMKNVLPLMAYINDFIIIKSRLFISRKQSDSAQEKLPQYKNYINSLLKANKNVFYDIIFPNLLEKKNRMEELMVSASSRDELLLFLEESLNYIRLCEDYHPQAEFAKLFNMEASVTDESFKAYYPETVGKLQEKDFFALVYKESIYTKERKALIQMAKYVTDSSFLMDTFNRIKYDLILYYHLSKHEDGNNLLKMINLFLQTYGLQPVKEWKYALSDCLYNKPYYVLGKIRYFLQADIKYILDSLNNINKEKDRIYNIIINKIISDKKEAFNRHLIQAEQAFTSKDDHAYHIERTSKSFLAIAFYKISNFLIQENILDNMKDINYLKIDELRDILKGNKIDVTDIVKTRKTEFINDDKIQLPLRYMENINNSAYKENTPNMLKGYGGMVGKVKGEVIFEPRASFENDTNYILVTSSDKYDIEEILPYLGYIKGIVLERGNPYSHMGITAREMGIIVMYNVSKACQLINQKDIVELDGSTGTVTIL